MNRRFEQPLAVHPHWHIDVSYINISVTFYYLCRILDGFSRYIVNWDLRESMAEAEFEVILERARELHPEAKSRIISDKGPQLPRLQGIHSDLGHVPRQNLPYYPQSNGKTNVGTMSA